MEQDRYQRGWARLLEVAGEQRSNQLVESLETVAPDMGRYIVEFIFGDVYNRDGLRLRERQIAQIAMFTALGGCEPQLEFHIGAALQAGLTPAEVVEVIIQVAPYTGFPRALNAVGAARRTFEAQGISLEEDESESARASEGRR